MSLVIYIALIIGILAYAGFLVWQTKARSRRAEQYSRWIKTLKAEDWERHMPVIVKTMDDPHTDFRGPWEHS